MLLVLRISPRKSLSPDFQRIPKQPLAGDRKYDNLEAKSIREILLGSIEGIEERTTK